MTSTGKLSSFQKIQRFEKYVLSFRLIDSNVAYANTLRRVMLCEVPSVGFRAEILKDGTTSDVKILQNTTAMSNEMFAHRIGLILINADPDGWDSDKYEFYLKVENTTDIALDVKVSDIIVYDISQGEKTQVANTKFFLPDPISKDTALLAVLKPKIGNSTVEAIEFRAKATVGNGKENIRFSPTSQCSYSYTRDENVEKRTKIFTNWLDQHKKISIDDLEADSDRKAMLEREFETMEAARCYVTNEKNEPSSFDFIVESVGALDPYKIVTEALKVLEKKCFAYSAIHTKIPENVKIQPTKKEARGFDIYFQEEDHTLGNLFTTWMDENMLDVNGIIEGYISYCGYCVPHPLRDEMLITILTKDETDSTCRKVLAKAAESTGKMFSAWREAFLREKI